ncbi:MAG: hypothetical protein Q8P67_23690, partial [archaeon]|nr:hypothetical protein [archaeon]
MDQESHGEEEEEEPVSTLKRLAPTFGKMPSRRRIKKPKTLEDEEEALEKQLFGDREDEGELLGDEFPSGDEGDVFNEAEEDARSRRSPGSDSDSESDDFIEMTREEREQRRKEKRFRKKNQSYGNQADLFGDAEAWAGFGGDSEEEAGSEEGYEGSAGRGSQRFHSSEDSDDGEDLRGPQREAVVSLDQFEPAVLAECFLTEQDLEITSRNVPERYQLLYGENITRGLPSATELQDEARWLGRSMDDLPIPHNEFVAFIRMVRFSKYDIPYIWHHQQAQ